MGTFFLVLVAAGGGMMSQAFPDTISRAAAVTAPGLMVMAIILFMGKVSGAHLNPAVSLAFAARGDFPWVRVPGLHPGATHRRDPGLPVPASGHRGVGHLRVELSGGGYSAGSAFWMEFILTLGLVSVILGTASGAQNIGIVGAFGVGAYIALAGLWGSPISGASMNPARTFGPTWSVATSDTTGCTWPDPSPGAAAAVLCGFVLRGRGGGEAGSGAAEGAIDTEVAAPGQV